MNSPCCCRVGSCCVGLSNNNKQAQIQIFSRVLDEERIIPKSIEILANNFINRKVLFLFLELYFFH